MPRKARVKSSTGIYHVMMRGINRQMIFDDGDCQLPRLCQLPRSKDEARDFEMRFDDVELGGEVEVRDVFERKEIGAFRRAMAVTIPAHGTRIFRLKAEERKERTLYEAETAYLSKYQELTNNQTAHSAIYENKEGASGGAVVIFLGK